MSLDISKYESNVGFVEKYIYKFASSYETVHIHLLRNRLVHSVDRPNRHLTDRHAARFLSENS